MQQGERSKQQRMNSKSVKFSYVNVNHGGLFLCGEFITFDEPGWILPITLAMRRIAVEVIYQLL
jgi:hypothetical protein